MPGSPATAGIARPELGRRDLVLVRPGESIPADGLVRKGASDVNEAMITGEPRPVKRAEGEEVIAGTISIDGADSPDEAEIAAGRESLPEAAAGSRREGEGLE